MFNGSEIEQMDKYLTKVESGKTDEYFVGLYRPDPDWLEVSPLFQRLIDYGVTNVQDAAMKENFREIKDRSDRADALFVDVHRFMSSFKCLLQTYKADYLE